VRPATRRCRNPRPATPATPEERDVLRVNGLIDEALAARDAEKFARLTSEDYVRVGRRGLALWREVYLK
jgi:hypothetical protein